MEGEYLDARRAWQGKLAEGGLAGRDVARRRSAARASARSSRSSLSQEIARAGVPGILDVIGVGMLGPTIIAHGTDEQKSRYLGADAARRRGVVPALLRARRRLGPRRRPDARRPAGRRRLGAQRPEGVDDQRAVRGVRPAARAHRSRRAQAQGPDDVHRPDGRRRASRCAACARSRARPSSTRSSSTTSASPADAVVGAVDGGWGTALTTLMFERLTIGLGLRGPRLPGGPLRARRWPTTPTRAADPDVRQRLGEIGTELLAVKFTGYRMLTALQKGQIPGPEAGPGQDHDGQRGDRRGRPASPTCVGPDALDEDAEWAYMISFLPGLKSAGGTEEILRNTIGERVLGLPPEPRLDKGIPFSELRAQGEGGGAAHEPRALRRAGAPARGRARRAVALQDRRGRARRARRRRAARPVADRPSRPGWPGLLVSEERGGAGLGAFDAMLVAQECGRVLAGVPLLGQLPATAILDAAGYDGLRGGRGRRAARDLAARPPAGERATADWTVDAATRQGPARAAPPAVVDGDSVRLTGTVALVPDAPGRRPARRGRRDRGRRAGRGGRRGGGRRRLGRARDALRRDARARPRHARRRAGTRLDVGAEQLAARVVPRRRR